MRRFLSLIFFFFLSFWNSQTTKISLTEPKLTESIQLLDQFMKDNDERIVDILCSDVSFGHSNGWVQNLGDFKEDFNSKKVTYKDIKQIEISDIRKHKNIYSVRRKINVSGTYKNNDFEIILSLLEIWKKEKLVWKLWSRQSVEIKP
ncbi:hypothetical protein [Chryseobacterium oryctis]|uniref:DUF4440 domain-containing protein n=1 Tax=Chryseobacterium oryctis TaxID=2952618 RepID=A0ABT3HLR7_9FLAO|nr:hypothetical protein [Chryseobacterium oryctis]MCW3160709.1 hypothetical protein [Chryseobacterium oryctis]